MKQLFTLAYMVQPSPLTDERMRINEKELEGKIRLTHLIFCSYFTLLRQEPYFNLVQTVFHFGPYFSWASYKN